MKNTCKLGVMDKVITLRSSYIQTVYSSNCVSVILNTFYKCVGAAFTFDSTVTNDNLFFFSFLANIIQLHVRLLSMMIP